MSSVLESPTDAAALVEPLRSGDVLDQPTFHQRYEEMPRGFHAELIEGVVYVPSPSSNWHAMFQSDISTWLGVYRAHTPGVEHGTTGTVVLDDANEPQPDAVLRLAAGGNSEVNAKGYLVGAPELHVEVAYSSASIDLHQKRRAYERAGVQEYLVVLIREPGVRAYRLDQKQYQECPPNSDGIWCSTVFPGLWLNVRALLDRDGKTLLETLQRGIATRDHDEFVARLQSVVE